MKHLGRIVDPKDITNKEYVDDKYSKLDEAKVNATDIVEYSGEEVSQLWKAALAAASAGTASTEGK